MVQLSRPIIAIKQQPPEQPFTISRGLSKQADRNVVTQFLWH